MPATAADPQTDDVLWDLENLKEARGLTSWMFEQFERDVRGRVLEVGAGIGTFSELLLEKPVSEALLMEPHPPCARVLEDQYSGNARARVLVEALPDAPSLAAEQESIDFILCQNVLEHIEDDVSALQAMAAVLKPGGRLGLLVPAHPRLYGPLDDAYGHERRYTKPVLRERLRRAGFEIDDLYAFNALGIPGWWVQNRRGTAANISRGSLRAYEALLRAWKPVERRWRPPWGLSAIAHARKPG
jgi:SAM-dependent methyltransferase